MYMFLQASHLFYLLNNVFTTSKSSPFFLLYRLHKDAVLSSYHALFLPVSSIELFPLFIRLHVVFGWLLTGLKSQLATWCPAVTNAPPWRRVTARGTAHRHAETRSPPRLRHTSASTPLGMTQILAAPTPPPPVPLGRDRWVAGWLEVIVEVWMSGDRRLN